MKPGIKQVLIADGHSLVRDGVRSLLEGRPQIQVVAEASTGREALDGLRSTSADIAIIELSLPDRNGIDLTRAIRREFPRTRVLIYTLYKSEELVREALGAGASSYVVKGGHGDDLLSALMACE